MLEDMYGYKDIPRADIKVDVTGINHFTWITSAHYKNINLFDSYKEFCEKYCETGFTKGKDDNWFNNVFDCAQRVKMDLFRRYGYIAAAGDRHLAEFCEGSWYLKDPKQVKDWMFGLTSVAWRKENLKERLQKSADLRSGKLPVTLAKTGEDGVNQMRALLGLSEMITNVNLPNMGQIPNLPLGAVVETNATFRDDMVIPVMAGNVPTSIHPLISRIVDEQELIVEAALKRDLSLAFVAFVNDPLVTISVSDAKMLFDEMIENTKGYLQEYFS